MDFPLPPIPRFPYPYPLLSNSVMGSVLLIPLLISWALPNSVRGSLILTPFSPSRALLQTSKGSLSLSYLLLPWAFPNSVTGFPILAPFSHSLRPPPNQSGGLSVEAPEGVWKKPGRQSHFGTRYTTKLKNACHGTTHTNNAQLQHFSEKNCLRLKD